MKKMWKKALALVLVLVIAFPGVVLAQGGEIVTDTPDFYFGEVGQPINILFSVEGAAVPPEATWVYDIVPCWTGNELTGINFMPTNNNQNFVISGIPQNTGEFLLVLRIKIFDIDSNEKMDWSENLISLVITIEQFLTAPVINLADDCTILFWESVPGADWYKIFVDGEYSWMGTSYTEFDLIDLWLDYGNHEITVVASNINLYPLILDSPQSNTILFNNRKLFSIFVSAHGGGTASPSVEQAWAGTTITLTANPQTNHFLQTWETDNNITIIYNSPENTATFIMPENDVDITVVFAEIIPITGIEISVNETEIDTQGGTLQFTVNVTPPNATFRYDINWSLTPSGIASMSPDGVFTAISDGEVTVRATSVHQPNMYSNEITINLNNQAPPPVTHPITVNTQGSGTASANVSQATQGATVTLTATRGPITNSPHGKLSAAA